MTTISNHPNGATVCVGSDRYAATIIERSESGKTITARFDKVTPAPGHSYYGQQRWIAKPRRKASKTEEDRKFRQDKFGCWCELGGSAVLLEGVRDHFSDPSF